MLATRVPPEAAGSAGWEGGGRGAGVVRQGGCGECKVSGRNRSHFLGGGVTAPLLLVVPPRLGWVREEQQRRWWGLALSPSPPHTHPSHNGGPYCYTPIIS